MKRASAVGSGFTLAVLLATSLFALAAKSGDNESESRIQKGLDISPVHLDLRGKNRAQAAMGSYLINAVGSCNDCHTCPSYAAGVEHNPYLGGDGAINSGAFLAGGLPFALGPVTVFSRNLTPDANGLPAGLTLDQFITTLRTGIEQHDKDILQVMPWPVFRNMNDRDLAAIYEYLRSIPHADTPPPGTCQVPGQGTLPTAP